MLWPSKFFLIKLLYQNKLFNLRATLYKTPSSVPILNNAPRTFAGDFVSVSDKCYSFFFEAGLCLRSLQFTQSQPIALLIGGLCSKKSDSRVNAAVLLILHLVDTRLVMVSWGWSVNNEIDNFCVLENILKSA